MFPLVFHPAPTNYDFVGTDLTGKPIRTFMLRAKVQNYLARLFWTLFWIINALIGLPFKSLRTVPTTVVLELFLSFRTNTILKSIRLSNQNNLQGK